MSSWFIALFAGPAILVPIALYALARRQVAGARAYGLLLLTIAWWIVAYTFELTVEDTAAKLLALRLKYVAIVAVPPAWIGFILALVGADKRRRLHTLVPLAAIAILTAAALWTDQVHGLFFGPMTLQPVGPYLVLAGGRGPGFYLNVAYIYIALGAGLVLLLLHTVHSPFLYRTRTLVLLIGTIVPWTGNAVFLLHGIPTDFDPTPFLFTCTAVFAALAVFRYDLLEPMPTLRDARIESVGDGVMLLDTKHRVADLNVPAQALLGRRRAEAAGRRIADLLPAWPHDTPPEGSLDVVHRLGATERILDVRVAPARTRAGYATGSVVLLRDVTERRAAEAQLRESERRYRTVIEQAFDGVFLTDGDGRLVDANPHACELLESPAEAIVGRPVADYLGSAIVADWLSDEGPLRRGEAVAWEHELQTPTGRCLIIAGRSKQIGPGLVVTTFRDVTDERAQARLRDRLLAEAQAANKLKDEFLATVTHEIRTPINAVVGWTHLLLNRRVAEEQLTDALLVIERNALAQARLVEDLLDLSGLAGGQTRLQRRRCQLAVVAREAADAVAPTASSKGVAVRLDLPPAVPELFADPDRLRQVLWNLLTNAIKFTPMGGRVTVQVTWNDGELVLSVADEGKGIAAEFLPHVFEAFRQGDPSSAGGSGGLGLGLTIVRRIVDAHGGRVEATSDGPGCGATFRVCLPFMQPMDLPTDPADEDEANAGAPTH